MNISILWGFSGPGLEVRAIFAADQTHAPRCPPVIAYLRERTKRRPFYAAGYHMELVLSDPIIKEPVLTVFDGNGRMFVAEMRSYMQDIDGNNQRARPGRVSVHWSSKHNGVYDGQSVFETTWFCRASMLPLADGVIINETDSDDFWIYRDTKVRWNRRRKKLFYSGGPRGGNLEHQAGGLLWDLDNWSTLPLIPTASASKGRTSFVKNTPPNAANGDFPGQLRKPGA